MKHPSLAKTDLPHLHLRSLLLLAAVFCSIAFGPLTGQVHVWTGSGTGDLFSDNDNWVGIAPPTDDSTSVLQFGAESGAPNYLVELDQDRSGGGSSVQDTGRIHFVSGASTYTLIDKVDATTRLYRLYGTAAADPAGAEFISILNESGVNQIFDIGIRQEAPGGNSPVEFNVYDAGTGGLTFNETIIFANNAKDLVLRGSGDISFTSIDNTTGAAAAIVVENSGTTTVSGAIRDVPKIEIKSGATLLFTGTGIDVIDDTKTGSKATSLILSGGTLALEGDAAQTAQFFGTLTLTADSVLDFGGSDAVIQFADSSAAIWDPNATLTIRNWNGIPEDGGGDEQLIFGTGPGGLTAQQLSQIRFEGFENYPSVQHLTGGEVVPVPEPATVFGGLLLGALALFRERHRLLKSRR